MRDSIGRKRIATVPIVGAFVPNLGMNRMMDVRTFDEMMAAMGYKRITKLEMLGEYEQQEITGNSLKEK